MPDLSRREVLSWFSAFDQFGPKDRVSAVFSALIVLRTRQNPESPVPIYYVEDAEFCRTPISKLHDLVQALHVGGWLKIVGTAHASSIKVELAIPEEYAGESFVPVMEVRRASESAVS